MPADRLRPRGKGMERGRLHVNQPRESRQSQDIHPSDAKGNISHSVSHPLSSVKFEREAHREWSPPRPPRGGSSVGSQRYIAGAYLFDVNHLVVGSSPANGGIAIRIHEEEPVTKMTEVAA